MSTTTNTNIDYNAMRAAATSMGTEVSTMEKVQTQISEIITGVKTTGFNNNAKIGAKLEQVESTNDGIIKTVLKDCNTMVEALNKVANDAEAQEAEFAKGYGNYSGSGN